METERGGLVEEEGGKAGELEFYTGLPGHDAPTGPTPPKSVASPVTAGNSSETPPEKSR